MLGHLRLHLVGRERHVGGERLRGEVARGPGELGVVLLRLGRRLDRRAGVGQYLQRVERRHIVGEPGGGGQKRGLDAGEAAHPQHFLVAGAGRRGDAELLLGGDDVDRLHQPIALVRVETGLAGLLDHGHGGNRLLGEVRFAVEGGVDGGADQGRADQAGQAGAHQPAQGHPSPVVEGVALASEDDGRLDALVEGQGMPAGVWAEAKRLRPHVSLRPPLRRMIRHRAGKPRAQASSPRPLCGAALVQGWRDPGTCAFPGLARPHPRQGATSLLQLRRVHSRERRAESSGLAARRQGR